MSERLNIESPRYDQTTFSGRAKHFFITTNPLNVLASDSDLEKAKQIVIAYRAGTEDKNLTEDEIWAAKQLYDSAFHCQTGEKLFLLGAYTNFEFMVIHKYDNFHLSICLPHA